MTFVKLVEISDAWKLAVENQNLFKSRIQELELSSEESVFRLNNSLASKDEAISSLHAVIQNLQTEKENVMLLERSARFVVYNTT